VTSVAMFEAVMRVK